MFNIIPTSGITVPMGYESYNTVPIGRYRKYCGLDSMCLRTNGFSGVLKLDYLYPDHSLITSCFDIDDCGIDIDLQDAELLRIST